MEGSALSVGLEGKINLGAASFLQTHNPWLADSSVDDLSEGEIYVSLLHETLLLGKYNMYGKVMFSVVSCPHMCHEGAHGE